MYQKLALSAVLALGLTATAMAQQPASLSEADVWSVVKETANPSDVFAFIENYPDGEYAMEARALMIDLLWTEVAEDPAETQDEAVVEAAMADPAEATPIEIAPADEAPGGAVQVTFTGALVEGEPHVAGRTLEQLIAGSPTFPPVEGLPESYWKTQSCSNCHEWKRENLCTQAGTYLSDAGAENLVKPHPYGGSFKANLRVWAESGCE